MQNSGGDLGPGQSTATTAYPPTRRAIAAKSISVGASPSERGAQGASVKALLKISLLVLASGSALSGTSVAANKAGDPLTAFGATVTHWNQHHRADTRFVRGSAYDPDTSLGDHRHFDDKYFSVSVISGRVETYYMEFRSGTGIAQAKAMVLSSEFPRDAKITWFKRKGTCAQMLVHSKTLERTIHQYALVEFSSGDAADYYDPSDASQLTLLTVTGSATGFDC
jgi:hypothetical protein